MLKTYFKESAGWIVRCCGMGGVLRTLLHRRRVAFLVYHDPLPGVFAQHAGWLARHYRFVSLDMVVNALESGDWSAVPYHALVITFDDGHRNNAILARLFQQYGISPVIYLCSQIVNTRRHFWWNEVPGQAESFKELEHDAFLRKLHETAGYSPEMIYGDRQALAAEELVALKPHVCFGAHTRFHPILPRCSEVEAREEIGQSRIELESILKCPVEHFAYPNGDFSARDVALVKKAGYRSARTIQPGWNGPGTDPFLLRAFVVEDDASLNGLALRLSGILVPLLTLRRWLLRRVRKGGVA